MPGEKKGYVKKHQGTRQVSKEAFCTLQCSHVSKCPPVQPLSEWAVRPAETNCPAKPNQPTQM